MLLRKFLKNKKANYAPIMTLAYVFFCLLWYVIMFAFSQDTIEAEYIGSMNNYNELNINESEDSSSVSYTDRSWVSKFFITVFGLPWWLVVFTVVFQGVFLVVIILSWVRGL